MLTMTQVQTPCADLHPDDVVLYEWGRLEYPPGFEPGPDYEPITPAVVVALRLREGDALPMALWARVFRLRPEVRAAREEEAEKEAQQERALSVVREVFPGTDANAWVMGRQWRGSTEVEAIHAGMGLRLYVDRDGTLRCIWGPLDSDRVVMNGSWAEVRERVIATLTAYLARKATREGTSARIVERRDRARALLAAMGETP